jgi:hypothetical protein
VAAKAAAIAPPHGIADQGELFVYALAVQHFVQLFEKE